MELSNKKINFLGDSITEGACASDKSHCFVSVFGQKTGAVCRNYGIGGTRIARQQMPSECPQWDLDYCKRATEMDKDADIIVVFGGTNDYGHGDAELGTPLDRTPDTFYGALHTLYRTLIEEYPLADIVVITPLHRENENSPRGDGKKPLSEYVKIIREVAESYSLPILDLFANGKIYPDIPVLKEKYTADGLHPNDRGYEYIANRLISFLNTL